jgi:pimeloyl-ACP methyl ester carboxylesterase
MQIKHLLLTAFLGLSVAPNVLYANESHLGWNLTSLPVYKNLEIRYAHNQKSESKEITLFSHGIGGTADQALHYMINDTFCTQWVATFDYADAPARIGKKNTYTGFAQQGEIDCFKAALKETIALNPQGIHLYGVSNGASTIINALDQLILEGQDLSLIRSVVLESPYADVNDCMRAFANQLMIAPTFFIRFLAKRWFKKLDFSKNKPLNAVSTLHALKVPILFIALDTDSIVPFSSTLKLYAALKRVSFDLTDMIAINNRANGSTEMHVDHLVIKTIGAEHSVHHANIMTPTTIAAVQDFYAKLPQHHGQQNVEASNNIGILERIKNLVH